MLWQKKRYEKKNSMFALIRSGTPNILFGAKLRNPTEYPAQSSFCHAQFASKIPHNFLTFFPHPVGSPDYGPIMIALHVIENIGWTG